LNHHFNETFKPQVKPKHKQLITISMCERFIGWLIKNLRKDENINRYIESLDLKKADGGFSISTEYANLLFSLTQNFSALSLRYGFSQIMKIVTESILNNFRMTDDTEINTILKMLKILVYSRDYKFNQ